MLAKAQRALVVARRAKDAERHGSLSRPVSALTVVWATAIKDLRVELRYLPDRVAGLIHLAFRVAFFLLLSSQVNLTGVEEQLGREMSGRSAFIFFQGALLLYVFNGTALWTPLNAVSRDLVNGTLEYLYSNPSSRYGYFVGTVLANAIISQVLFVPLFAFLWVYTRASAASMAMVLLVCLAVLITLMAMGVLIALLGLLWRQVSSVAQVLGTLFEFLAGAYFPVTAFPPVIRYAAYALPYTWGYDLVRYYSFDGQWRTLLPVWMEWLILAAYAVIFTLLSRYMLARVERRAKQHGLHLI